MSGMDKLLWVALASMISALAGGCENLDEGTLYEELDPDAYEIPDELENLVTVLGGDLSDQGDITDLDMLVVIEARLIEPLTDNLIEYFQDLEAEGVLVALVPWYEGNVDDLRDLLRGAHQKFDLSGAWLLGELPAAWYEQHAFDRDEEFPFDIYLMDLDATWEDSDGDAIFDGHSEIKADIFVSRLQGSEEELKSYFTKLHSYRKNGTFFKQSAHIFKDDDWSEFKPGKTWGLENLYTEVDAIESTTESTKESYVQRLTGSGAEYVYQWIHANAKTLIFSGEGGGRLTVDDIAEKNLKGVFYNLFDCSAARFTQKNLAMTYLTETDYGLATIGSTKAGGVYTPEIFHEQLADGYTWGEAYLEWYNEKGQKDDEWYLGIVVFGDPMLTLRNSKLQLLEQTRNAEEVVSAHEMEMLTATMKARVDTMAFDTFAEYRTMNPAFFR